MKMKGKYGKKYPNISIFELNGKDPELASQCGYVVSTSAFRQGVPGSNPIAARKSCEVYPGLGILQPQWNPYPTLPPPSC